MPMTCPLAHESAVRIIIMMIIKRIKRNEKIQALLICMLFVIAGCSTMTVTEKDQKRSELDAMAETAIAGLIEQDANVKTEMDKSIGYAVANMKLVKVPLIGAGGGEGFFVDKKTNKRTYFTVKRLDIGGGWGGRSFKLLIVVYSQEILDRLGSGTWVFQAGAEASVGKAAAEGSTSALKKDFNVYVLSDGGASATVTARVIRIKVNSELANH